MQLILIICAGIVFSNKLTDTLNTIQSTLNNETFHNTIGHLPQMAKLISSVVNKINDGGIQKVLGPGIKISELFEDTSAIKYKLEDYFNEADLDNILNARLKFNEIVNIFKQTNNSFDICDPKQMDLILILPDGASIEKVTQQICDIKPEKVPTLIQQIIKTANFGDLLKMITNLMSNFVNYNIFDDLSKVINTTLNIETVKIILPKELKIQEWLPKIISNINFNEEFNIENYLNISINELDPYFENNTEWINVKKVLENLINSDFNEKNYNSSIEKYEKDVNGIMEEKYIKITKKFYKLLFEFSKNENNKLEKIATVLDFLTSIPISEIGSQPIKKVWENLKNCTTNHCQHLWLDEIISTLKYFSASLTLATKTFNEYFKSITNEKVDIFTLAGFEKNSGPKRMFEKLPEVLNVLVDTYRDEGFENKIAKILNSEKIICKDIFRNLVINNVSITREELLNFMKYICISVFDYPILKENLFLQSVSDMQNFYLDISVSKLNYSFVEMLKNIEEIDLNVEKIRKNGVTMKNFFEDEWKSRMVDFMKKFSQMKFDANTTLNRYFKYFPKQYSEIIFGFQKFSVLSSYISETLKNYSKTGYLDLDSEKNKDIKKIIELFKQNPIEVTIIISETITDRKNENNFFSNFCSGKRLGYRSSLSKYDKNFTEKICQVDFSKIGHLFNAEFNEEPNFIIEKFISNVIKIILEIDSNKSHLDLSIEELDPFNLTAILKELPDLNERQKLAKAKSKFIFEKFSSYQIKNVENQLQISKLLFKVLRGGDFWPKIIEDLPFPSNLIPKIIEGIPFLPLDLLKTVTTTNILYDLINKAVHKENICDYKLRKLDKNNVLPKIHKLGCIVHKIIKKKYDWIDFDKEMITDLNLEKKFFDYENAIVEFIQNGTEKLILPQFLDEEHIKKEYTSFVDEAKQPFKILQSFSITLNQFINIASIFTKNETNCLWCTMGTQILMEVNKHIKMTKTYIELTCQISSGNKSDVAHKLKSLVEQSFNNIDNSEQFTIDDFYKELHESVDIISTQLIIFASNSTLQKFTEKCFENMFQKDSLSHISSYIEVFTKVFDFTKHDDAQLVEKIKKASLTNKNDATKYKIINTKVNMEEIKNIKVNNVLDLSKLFPNLNKKILEEINNNSNEILKVIKENDLRKNVQSLMSNETDLISVYKDVENIMGSLGDILNFLITNNIDIFDGKYNISALLKGALKLVKRKSIDILFDSLRDLIRALSPNVLNSVIRSDLEKVLETFKSMGLFKKLNLLHITFNLSNIIDRDYLVKEMDLNIDFVDVLLKSEVDVMEILATQQNINSLSCNKGEIQKYLDFDNTVDVDKLTKVICNLNLTVAEKILPEVIKNIKIEKVLNKIVDSSLDNIVKDANLTSKDAKEIINNLGNGIKLLNDFKVEKLTQGINLSQFDSKSVTPELLQESSALLCGRKLALSSNKFIKMILDAKDFNKNNNPLELKTPFCQSIYESVIKMGGGKIVWTYVKPFLRGKILYTPNTPEVENIIKEANFTFREMDNFKRIVNKMADGISEFNINGKIDLNSLSNSSVMKIILHTVLNYLNITDFSLDKFPNAIPLGDTDNIKTILRSISNLIDCVRIDRFVGVSDEKQLEIRSKQLMLTNEFIAGVVFTDLDNFTYKIRMDIEAVPSTNGFKYAFWTPGPEDNFLQDLRYFRSFIQLQDMIDSALIKLKSLDIPKVKTYTQQFPYPCWTNDYFISGMSISQSFQVCFFFGFIVLVAISVRYLVWEKESGNSMLMNIMGLKYYVYSFSWYIMTFIQMLILVTAIVIILKVGNILPLTSTTVLFLYLLEFGFATIMFCYMVSSFFNSASLGGVASVILYLITFMPYIIIISLESTLSFTLRMLTKFFMSTSFCYGCLYMIRFEVQGTGLNWKNVWDTPILNDPMTFGHSFVFLLIDALIYGLIGYLVSKKMYGRNYQSDTYQLAGFNEKIGVSIKGLTKIYNTSKKNVKAIENIDMNLYKGQVTTLLGHNGAGKTTLIKILTGMMSPTCGEVSINNDMTGQNLGVCSQKSVLIENLTPREHIFFYARLKTGKSYSDAFVEVVDMIESVGLGPLVNELVRNLSEGIRRRLCVAIAFIGEPKLVVLDEPSSGVDPLARRQIWELILKHKEGRTVLLTTHYLDEAELLSDRIVILHKGKIICSGTPLELKHNYGKGYDINFEYSSVKDEDVKSLMNTIKNTTYNATLTQTSNTNVIINVPFKNGNTSNDFYSLTHELEEYKNKLGFIKFNMNCSTLENVFLEQCKLSELENHSNGYTNKVFEAEEKLDSYEITDKKDISFLTNDGQLSGSTPKKVVALFKKRFIHFCLDWRIILCALVLPTLFTAIAMGFSLIRPPNSDDPSLKLSPDLYKNHSTAFINFDGTKVSENILELYDRKTINYKKTSRSCTCDQSRQTCLNSSFVEYNRMFKMASINDTFDWLLETQDEYIERRYGGFSLLDNNFVVWYNNKGHHSMPSFLNLLNNARLKSISPQSSITTFNHPLKLSPSQLNSSTVAQHIADIGIAAIILIAFTLVLASNSIFLVQERTNEEKRLQFLSGVSPNIYWLVATFWDFFVLTLALCLAVIVFKIFGLTIYVGRENLAAVCLLIILYGWATIPFFHLMEKFFHDASMANVILFCSYMFTGVAAITCILLIDIVGYSDLSITIRNILYEIYFVLPPFAFIDGLVQVSKNNIQAELLERFNMDTYISPISWELLGKHFVWMSLLGFVFFVLNLVVENKWIKSIRGGKRNSNYSDNFSQYAVEIVNLKKIYNGRIGKKVAVGGINLRVPRGQCIGLIGVNGAGKSTTFKMLTTEITPTSGQIYIQGQRIGKRPLFTGEIGYCPQCDALDSKLTVKQTLEFYCQLRGTKERKKTVEKVLRMLELKRYENRRCENLSGGNKRKLCAAVACLGNSSVILMDEPTSGMDPHSKTITSNLIKQLLKLNKSVVLTSHSVEDCENLCSSVIVMINGQIICEGSPQDLKDRFGNGYILSIRVSESIDQNKMEECILEHLPNSKLHNRQYCSTQFLINTDIVSNIFKIVDELSNNISLKDFSIVQSSLDQVFVNLAKNKENSDEVSPNSFIMSIM